MGDRRSKKKRVKEKENVSFLRETRKVWEGEAFLRKNRSIILRGCGIVTGTVVTILTFYLIFKFPVVRCKTFYEGYKARYVCSLPHGWKIADATNIKDQTGAVTIMLRPIGMVPRVVQTWMWFVMIGALIFLLGFMVISLTKDIQSRQRLAKDIRRANAQQDPPRRLSRSRTKAIPRLRNRSRSKSSSSSASTSSEGSVSSYTSRSPSPVKKKSRRRKTRRAVNKLEYI